MPHDVVVILVIIAIVVDLLGRLFTGRREVVGGLLFLWLATARAVIVVGIQILLELSSLFGIVDLKEEAGLVWFSNDYF